MKKWNSATVGVINIATAFPAIKATSSHIICHVEIHRSSSGYVAIFITVTATVLYLAIHRFTTLPTLSGNIIHTDPTSGWFWKVRSCLLVCFAMITFHCIVLAAIMFPGHPYVHRECYRTLWLIIIIINITTKKWHIVSTFSACYSR